MMQPKTKAKIEEKREVSPAQAEKDKLLERLAKGEKQKVRLIHE